jgi:hypothetical protein
MISNALIQFSYQTQFDCELTDVESRLTSLVNYATEEKMTIAILNVTYKQDTKLFHVEMAAFRNVDTEDEANAVNKSEEISA